MLRKKLIYGSIYGAVEHTYSELENETFNILFLEKQKNELIVKKREQINNINDIFTKLYPKKHLFLIVNNKNVLSKVINLTNTPSLNIVKKAFPNININDFYYEIISNESKSFIAISRKDYINNLIEMYQKEKFHIINFSLGNSTIKNLINLTDTNELYTSNSLVVFKNNFLDSIEKESASIKYRINDLDVSNNDILCLSGILSHHFIKNKYSEGLEEIKENLINNFYLSRFFKLGLYSALVTLFIIVLTNFLFFTKYHSGIEKLTPEIEKLSSYKKELLELESTIERKEKLINSLQSSKNSKVSLFINEIAKEIPKTILLSELKYQPLISKIKNNSPLKISSNKIFIRGTTESNNDFYFFISSLEKKKWISNTTIINYGKNKKGSTSLFEILISLKNE